jgi:hypothetical protein
MLERLEAIGVPQRDALRTAFGISAGPAPFDPGGWSPRREFAGCGLWWGGVCCRVVGGHPHWSVSDIEAVRDELDRRGIQVSEVFHCTTGTTCRFRDRSADGRISGPAPDRTSYGSFASFSDPDGNGWIFQEVTTRLPGRIDLAATSFGSAGELASAFRRAAAAHGAHEKRIGEADANWPDWYADYMVREQAGTQLPS